MTPFSPWNSPGKNIGVGSLSLLQGIFPTQRSNPSLPHLWVDSLPAEPQGKPKNTEVGNLSLLQGIFPTQELNQGLLHCRQILYQLSYQGSPGSCQNWIKLQDTWDIPGGASGKESACQCWRCKSRGFHPRVTKIFWRRKWQPTPVFLPGESHGQRSLAGYSTWGCKELDTTEVT